MPGEGLALLGSIGPLTAL